MKMYQQFDVDSAPPSWKSMKNKTPRQVSGALSEILKKLLARNFIKNKTHTQILESLCEELFLMR